MKHFNNKIISHVKDIYGEEYIDIATNQLKHLENNRDNVIKIMNKLIKNFDKNDLASMLAHSLLVSTDRIDIAEKCISAWIELKNGR